MHDQDGMRAIGAAVGDLAEDRYVHGGLGLLPLIVA
jgi:hypothetical protein